MNFGEYPQSFYPQLFIACVVVPGTELGDTGSLGERFIDNKRVEGTIEEMLNGTMNFLRRNMKTSIIIDENGNRKNRTEYPLEALREAVANALIHRDYSPQTQNTYISVSMYDNRIEILSPGALYGGNKLEKLGTATTMEVRNPTIVKILEEKKSVIENRHSGIPTMKIEMKKYGLPDPEFYEEQDSFKVVFKNNKNINAAKCEPEITKCEPRITKCESKTTKCEPGIIKCEQKDEDFLRSIVLKYCLIPRTAREICDKLGNLPKRYVANNIIKPLINIGKLEYTNKKCVNAKNQKYKTKKIQ